MGIIRDSFIIFKNWADAIDALPQRYQLECYKGLMQYGTTGEMPAKLSPVSKALLVSFSVAMENSIGRYIASVENGKKGGRPPKNNNLDETPNNLDKPSENLEKPRITQQNLDEPTHNLNVNVNDNKNIKKEKVEKKKANPTLDEIKEYANSRGRPDLAVKFYEYYTEGNWIDSKGDKVRNWKQRFITWCNKTKQDCNILHQRDYATEDFNSVFDNFKEIEIGGSN